MADIAFQNQVMEILGIDASQVSPIPLEKERELYAAAYGLYEKEEYRQAAQLFTQLVLADPFSEHFWQGLASSKQMSRDHNAAMHAWSMVALLKDGDPMPHFHAAECLLCLEQKEEALKALDAALSMCNDDALREKIDLLKAIHYVNH